MFLRLVSLLIVRGYPLQGSHGEECRCSVPLLAIYISQYYLKILKGLLPVLNYINGHLIQNEECKPQTPLKMMRLATKRSSPRRKRKKKRNSQKKTTAKLNSQNSSLDGKDNTVTIKDFTSTRVRQLLLIVILRKQWQDKRKAQGYGTILSILLTLHSKMG